MGPSGPQNCSSATLMVFMPVNIWSTDIWLRVMVPVLSRQTVCTDPRVSTALRWRIKTWCLRMSRMPRARVVVAAAGSPSGTAAAARQMEVRSISSQPNPHMKPMTNTTPQTLQQMHDQLIPQLAQLPLQGSLGAGGLADEALNPPDFGVTPGGHHHRQALAAGHQGAHEDHVDPVSQGNILSVPGSRHS